MLHNSKFNNEKGQIMLFTVLVMSAVFLSVTVISGMLMLNQLGQVERIQESAQAIYAADAGIERGLFLAFRCGSKTTNNPFPGQIPYEAQNEYPAPIMPAGWQDLKGLSAICFGASNKYGGQLFIGPPLGPCEYAPDSGTSIENLPGRFCNAASYSLIFDETQSPPITPIQAVGRAGKSARAFEVNF